MEIKITLGPRTASERNSSTACHEELYEYELSEYTTEHETKVDYYPSRSTINLCEIEAFPVKESVPWENDPKNPYNWRPWKKGIMLAMISAMGLTTAIATSILSSSHEEIKTEFYISDTVAFLPMTCYIIALGLGPVVGGPLSETIGRYPVYLGGMICGALFTLGAGLTHSFIGLCVLKFLAGFFWAPILSNAPGSLAETFMAKTRGPMSAVFILMSFLGPALGPVLGSFVSTHKGWRWTQFTMLIFSALPLLMAPFTEETFHPVIQRRVYAARGMHVPLLPPFIERMRTFAVVALIRPIRMLFTEPIVAFICLYIAIDFGTLFTFFTAMPYTFGSVYGFNAEQSGLVFLAIGFGCLLGLATVMIFEVVLYRRQIPKYPAQKVPPEHRLYSAMIGCFGLPIGLFCFAWSTKSDISWTVPVASIIPFAWGNICVFVSLMQYTQDTYTRNVVASASSANSLARYGFAGVFPLFTMQMYEALGIHWASSLLGFITIALLPTPWVLYKYGPRIRARSNFETQKYED